MKDRKRGADDGLAAESRRQCPRVGGRAIVLERARECAEKLAASREQPLVTSERTDDQEARPVRVRVEEAQKRQQRAADRIDPGLTGMVGELHHRGRIRGHLVEQSQQALAPVGKSTVEGTTRDARSSANATDGDALGPILSQKPLGGAKDTRALVGGGDAPT